VMGHILKQKMSFPVDGKAIIFNELKKGDDVLFLYGQNIKKEPAFFSFIKSGIDNDEFCLYAFDSESNSPNLKSNGKLELLPINFARKKNLISKLGNMFYSQKPIRILIDFGGMANKNNMEDIIFCGELIRDKINEFSKKRSRIRYKRGLISNSIIALTAFDIGYLENETIKKLMGLHKKIVFSTENEFMALLPNFSTAHSIGNGSLDSIPFEVMEKIVKASLEMIILSRVSEKPMCGFDIIKAISQQYHVFLSQGTVYPMLYSLEKRNILKAQNSSKAKVYDITADGREIAEKKLADFLKAHEYLSGLLSKNKTFSDFEMK